jgi:molybdopterin-binding protein
VRDRAAVIVDVARLAVRVPVRGLVCVLMVAMLVPVLRTCHAYELAIPKRSAANNSAMVVGMCRPAGHDEADPVVPARQHSGAGQIGAAMRLSARNKIDATVTSLTRGEATANVVLDAGGTRLVASITVEAAAELGLAEGSKVTAIIKASDVIIGVPD